MDSLETEILQVYNKNKEKCERCKAYCKKHEREMHGPLSYFKVGGQFENNERKIVFVGKTHWYNKKQVKELNNFNNSIFKDCRNDCLKMFKNDSRFLVYIRKMTEKVYPDAKSAEELLERIAITNLTKCNTSEGSDDTTPYYLTNNCIELFEKEIELLNPARLIFFTGAVYDDYILKLNFGFINSPIERKSQRNKVKIGNLQTLWWEREFSDNKRIMHVLRTRHPVRAPSGFVDKIVSWIKS